MKYLALGAGVQSSTIAEMIVEEELPLVDVAIFADTGDEPQDVYAQVDYLRGRLQGAGVPLAVVNNGELIPDLMRSKGRFASIPAHTINQGEKAILRRQCTNEYKIIPINRHLKSLLVEAGSATRNKVGAVRTLPDVIVEGWLGISLDEVRRMRQPREKWLRFSWPLIEKRMSRHDCKLWLTAKKLPIPSRSSCRICPYHDDHYWKEMKDNRIDDWVHAVEMDEFIRSGESRFEATARGPLYLHRSLLPLEIVDLSTPQEKGQTDFLDICDEGYCFI